MESIVVDLKSAKQLKVTALPLHVSESIQKSLKQFENGQTISLEEFKQKHFIQK